MNSFVKVTEQLHDSDVWKFSNGVQVMAYIDLLFYVQKTEVDYNCRYGTIHIRKGQKVTSYRELAELFHVKLSTCRSIINFLKTSGLITMESAFARETARKKAQYSVLTVNELREQVTRETARKTAQEVDNNNLSKDKYITNTCARRFVKPTVQEVQTELDRRRITSFSAEDFWSYYESCGWTVGRGKPMKSWKYCINTWIRFENRNGNGNNYRPRDRKAEADERNRQFAGYIFRKVGIGAGQGHDTGDGGRAGP